MPLIAGFSDSLHDRSVCLFEGARPLVAIEEERLTRIKHGLDLQGRSSDDPALFSELDLESDSPDKTRPGLEAMLAHCLDTVGADRDTPLTLCGNSLHNVAPWSDRALFVNHHLAHAASAYFASGYDEAAIIVADGYGDRSGPSSYETVLIAHGVGTSIRSIRAISGEVSSYFDMHNSLGVMYRLGTLLSGFAMLEEGKAMGLSAYGKPSLRAHLDRHVSLEPDGVYVNNGALWRELQHLHQAGLDFNSRADIAASFQASLEDALLHYAALAHDLTGAPNLCLAGGVALNCVANGRIAAEGPYETVFVPPAPGDNGIAFGAATLVAHTVLGLPIGPQLRRTSWGACYGSGAIDGGVSAGRLVPVEVDDLIEGVADVLVGGHVIAVVRDGAEFGPRALGHRSLLALPQSAATRDFINQYVKHRETFRPLAPIVAEEDVADWFEWDSPSPFMLFTVPAKEALKTAAPAVVHYDGTARLQTVSAADDPWLHALLKAIGARTGCPVLLNTSLNGRGEPIVETPAQAVTFLESAPVDYLLLEDRLLVKASAGRGERLHA